MSEAVKIAALVLCTLVLTVIFKKEKAEYSFVLSLSAVVLVSLFVIKTVFASNGKFGTVISLLGASGEYIEIALKVLCIAVLTTAVADTCRDFGQSALGFAAETGGKCLIFGMCLPLLIKLLNAALEFLKL